MTKAKSLLKLLSVKKPRIKSAAMTSVFFRRTKGKIQVISKHVKIDKNEGTLNVFLQNKGRTIGDMMIDIRDKSYAMTLDTRVDPEFRKKGLSRKMFKSAADALSKIGKKFFRSGELRSSAQAKIRGKYNTKFIEQYAGRYSEQTRFNIKKREAISLIEGGKTVQATTKLPLERVSHYKTHKYVYRRIRGRIVPVKVKK